jgi:protein associated with RNAse G/E
MNQKQNTFTINSRKFDGEIYRSWKAELIEQTKTLLIFAGIFENEINHTHLGIIRPGTVSYEYYWTNRWYNIFRFHEPEGELRNFYCNVNQPPVFDGSSLNYIDLDIDVLVWKDLSFEILDWDEYKDNADKFKYSPELKNKVNESLKEILNLIKNKSFPFDFGI